MNLIKLLFYCLLLTFLFSSCTAIKELEQKNEKLQYKYDSAIKQKDGKIEKKDQEIIALKFKIDSLQYLLDSLYLVTGDSTKGAGINPADSLAAFKINKKYVGKVEKKSKDKNNNESIQLALKNINFQAYVVEDPLEIEFFWKNKKDKIIGNLKNLKDHFKRDERELIFGMNAGIFTRDRAPEGLFVENGIEKIKLNEKKGKGNFYLEPNGVFFIEKNGNSHVMETSQFKKKSKDFDIMNATQSGPMLVINGKIHDVFVEGSNNLNIRNGVGVDENGKVIFIITSQPVNLFTFASIFRNHFKCKNALYLDGAISQAFIPQLGKNGMDGNFGPLIGVFKK